MGKTPPLTKEERVITCGNRDCSLYKRDIPLEDVKKNSGHCPSCGVKILSITGKEGKMPKNKEIVHYCSKPGCYYATKPLPRSSKRCPICGQTILRAEEQINYGDYPRRKKRVNLFPD